MIPIIFLLAVFLVLVWLRVIQESRRLRDFEIRFNLLEQRLANVQRRLNDLRDVSKSAPGAAPPEQPMPAEAALSEKQPVVEITAPAAPPPKIERQPVPVAKTVPRETPPAEPPFIPPPVTPPPSWKLPKLDWESLVGVKLSLGLRGWRCCWPPCFFSDTRLIRAG